MQVVSKRIINSIQIADIYLNKYSKIGKWVYDIDWNDKEDLTFSTLEILKHKKKGCDEGRCLLIKINKNINYPLIKI